MVDQDTERHYRHHNVWKPQSFTSVERTLTERRLFSYGLNTGGPGVMSIGWIIVSIFSTHLPRYVGKDG